MIHQIHIVTSDGDTDYGEDVYVEAPGYHEAMAMAMENFDKDEWSGRRDTRVVSLSEKGGTRIVKLYMADNAEIYVRGMSTPIELNRMIVVDNIGHLSRQTANEVIASSNEIIHVWQLGKYVLLMRRDEIYTVTQSFWDSEKQQLLDEGFKIIKGEK